MAVIVTELPVFFPLVVVKDRCVLQILRNLSAAPDLKQRRQLVHQSVAAVLVDFSRDPFGSPCLPTGQLLHGSDCFSKKRLEVQSDTRLDLWESADGGVGDCVWTVEETSEVLGPALRNLRLLRQER
ncbi:hypothetical protein SprV_0200677400 [Sparganum proliferum]